MRCSGAALAVLACACLVAAQAAPARLVLQPRETTHAAGNGRGLLHKFSHASDDEAVLQEMPKPPASSMELEDADDGAEDFKSLWHRTPLEMFLAWLYGIFIIVAVGGLAAVVAAKLGFFDSEDDSVIPISPRTNAYLFQSTEDTTKPNMTAQEQQRSDACLNVKFKPYQTYHQAGTVAQSISVHPNQVRVEPYPRYECCPNPTSADSEAAAPEQA